MGASSSSFTSNVNQQNTLLQQINGIALELSEAYTTKFLDPGFCMKVGLIYQDKLNTFKKHELNGVAYQLGLIADVPQLKEKICESIVKHYTDRNNLISAIVHSLSFCSNRIFALTSGPRCEGNPEIFDQVACTKSGGKWTSYVIPPDHNIEDNMQWYQNLKMMQEQYLLVLTRLLEILKQLKNYDEDINDERLKIIGHEVSKLIDAMHTQCGELYKLALVTPTFTDGELAMISEQNNIAKQEGSARLAALRTARGLPPVGPE